jgi:hypothetical protein
VFGADRIKLAWLSGFVVINELSFRAVFLNRRAATRYRAVASVITGPREVLLEVVILVF